jgi:hypothetical protein
MTKPGPGCRTRVWRRIGGTVGDNSDYLVRYGLMGHVGRFSLDPASDQVPQRGHTVVIRTDRGLEIGEVLGRLATSVSPRPAKNEIADGGEDRDPTRPPDPDRPGLLRMAGQEDLERARRSETLRNEQFAVCRRLLEEGGWPLDLLDVEPLLDLSTTVLHVLGPHDLDLALLRARFRSVSNFDIVFESVGSEPSFEHVAATDQPRAGAGRCGDCDCGEGGCGSASGGSSGSRPATRAKESEQDSALCHETTRSACSSCGVSQWLAERRGSAV